MKVISAACWSSYRFNAIAESSECQDHFASPPFSGLGVHGWTALFVTHPAVQNDPDQTTKPVGDRADGLAALYEIS
jgi:hypothetical protein